MAQSETDELQDTEITLGTGKLLGIFFGLVLLCSVFFTMGYMFGRANAAGSKTEIVGSESSAGAPDKPSAVNKSGETGPAANAASSQPSQVPANASPAPASSIAPATLAPVSTTTTTAAAQPQNNVTTGGTYMVQVAAVSKREDADLLVTALQKKQYPVFVASAPGDALFHVQVGPFTDPKDAETMRSRLASDGYNAIVKK